MTNTNSVISDDQKKKDSVVSVQDEQNSESVIDDAEKSLVDTGQDLDIPADDKVHVFMGWFVIIVVFGIFGVWSFTAPLNSAAVAPGEVTVETSNLSVAHLEGGVIANIMIKEGELVDKGQVLIKLSPTQAAAELQSIQSRLYDVLSYEARLKAERVKSETIEFPIRLIENQNIPDIKELMEGQIDLFLKRKSAHELEFKLLKQQKEALKEQITGLQNLIVTQEKRIASYQKELNNWLSLYEEKLTDTIRIEQMKRSIAELEGESAQYYSEIARLKVAISENESKSALRDKNFIQKVVEELRVVQGKKYELNAAETALLDKMDRIDIISPAKGYVQGLTVFTEGGVILPGKTIMEIVPYPQNYTITARVDPADIDIVRTGLEADVTFSAFKTQMVHVVKGTVTRVSADSFMDQYSGLKYFEAKVVISSEGLLQMEQDGLFMLPGMPAETFIKTGERTFFDYLVRPLVLMLNRSFNEQ